MHLKSWLTIAAALVAIAPAASAKSPAESPAAPADTLTDVNGVRQVVVTKKGQISTITLTGSDKDPHYYYSLTTEVNSTLDLGKIDDEEWGLSLPFLNQRSHKKSRVVWGNDFYIGVTVPTAAPKGLSGSIECGLGKIVGLELQPWQGGPQFGIGFGFHYRQFTLHHGQVFLADHHRLSIIPVEADRVSSRLRNFGFQVPVTITQNISNGFGITIGAAAMFNTFTCASSTTYVNDLQFKNSYRNLHQRLLTLDLMAAIGWTRSASLYVRYSPLKLFNEQWGPQFNTLSFGLSLSM
ncbi:MAG: hypothetical protein K2H61_09865 [Muribaculaceae bacterium]|nr:hypothetical protein [Muribaculaceae bacterium]MDE7393002.1 hypothetical protein [Muribaculaceae bacterium]